MRWQSFKSNQKIIKDLFYNNDRTMKLNDLEKMIEEPYIVFKEKYFIIW